MTLEIIGESSKQDGGCIVGTDELIVQALNDIVVELRNIKEIISRLRT